jgi:DNA ligase D-like protein (predicted 3'-phosphoesterase)
MADRLAEYRKRRNFSSTPEPSGGDKSRSRKGPPEPRFVIQEHAASSLHYDFRLELDGVLKSWAVPKGPSTDPSVKRLAVMTEDHPLDYIDFEGVIPTGYGAGRVIVWDTGTYRNLHSEPVAKGLEQGHISVWLEGKKLRGGYAMTRLQHARDGHQDEWLLVKRNDEGADRQRDPVAQEPESVLSGATVDNVT